MRFLIFLSILLSFSLSSAELGKEMQVIATGLNVRTASGGILCSIRKNERVTVVGRHADGQRIKVQINRRGCPKEGFVYANFLKPTTKVPTEGVYSRVDVSQLSMRSLPKVTNRTYRCALPKNALVQVTEDVYVGARRSQWFKVKLKEPISGCPDEGFVNGSYLIPDESFQDLPEAVESKESIKMENVTEAQAPCQHCEITKKAPTSIGVEIVEALTPYPRNDFLEGIREMVKKPRAHPEGLITHRGLVQLPLIGKKGNIAACGSHHYNPDKPVGIDAYANPLTACAFVSFLQDWRKKQCPDEARGCRIAWGDISHKTRPKFGGHQTHTDGECIDIRPLRNGAFQDAPMTYQQGGYDREKTTEMIRMLKAKGASVVLFNDPKAGGEYSTGHHNHIHVCFKKSPKVEDTCDGLSIDPETCPELE